MLGHLNEFIKLVSSRWGLAGPAHFSIGFRPLRAEHCVRWSCWDIV